MVVDMLSHPNLDQFDLSSLQSVGGGGAAMPEAIGNKLKTLVSADYIEGYGMSETMAATHINPTQRRCASAWASPSSMWTPAWSTRAPSPNCRPARSARSSCTARR